MIDPRLCSQAMSRTRFALAVLEVLKLGRQRVTQPMRVDVVDPRRFGDAVEHHTWSPTPLNPPIFVPAPKQSLPQKLPTPERFATRTPTTRAPRS